MSYVEGAYGNNRAPFWPLFALLALALLAAQPALATPKIQHWQTRNGAQVYFVPAHELPMVDLRVVFDAGSARDHGKAGLAQLTNTLLADGAGPWSADQIADRFDSVGAQFGNDSLRDMAILSLRTLRAPKQMDTAVDTFTAVLTRPHFSAKDFNRERARMLQGVRFALQEPGEVASRAFYKALYGDHPYASPPDGTEASLKALTRKQVEAFYERYYVARNAVVAIVGDLDRAAAEKLAETVTGTLPAGQHAPTLPPVKPLAKAETIRIHHPSSQTHVLVGAVGITRNDPERLPLVVANHVLGGGGLVSRLAEEVREKRGLSYSVYSGFQPMAAPGPFMLGLQTRNAKAAQALKVMDDTLKKYVAEGPTGKELEAAKKNITGGFPLALDSNRKIVGNIAMIGFYHLPLNYLDTYVSRIDAVSRRQAHADFDRHVHPGRMLTVIVGGGEKDSEQ